MVSAKFRKEKIMSWIKRDGSKTVEEIIKRNTGLTASDFLNSAVESSVTNAYECALAIEDAILEDKPITIIGDYDADGITAASILYLTLNHFQIVPKVRFPKRFSEGYGISDKMIDEIDEGVLITVDNGIAAHDCIKKAKEKGLSTIIIDHHLFEGSLPEAHIIVNPHVIGNDDFKDYCGAGLAYKICKEILLRSNKSARYTVIKQIKALAAIGTVADVVPLIKENRKIVIEGMEEINSGNVTNGLSALLKIMKVSKVDEGTIGYNLAPIINASGRLNDNGALLVFKLLASNSNDKEKLEAVAEKLISINNERKTLVSEAIEKANEIYSEDIAPAIILNIPEINEGIIGIIAGKLAETYKKPCVIFSNSKEEGFLKGSGRSYGNIHLKKLLDMCSEFLYKYGGHSGAAGMTVSKENYSDFKMCFINALISKYGNIEFKDEYYDLDINPEDVNQVYEEVLKYAPYGEGNEPILFKINNFEGKDGYSNKYRVLGDEHIKIIGKHNDALAFGLYDKFIPLAEEKSWNLIGDMYENTFNGITSIQIKVRDFV